MSLSDRIRNRAARLRNHRWRMRPYRSSEHHIVIGGSPRSGTTLLRQLLDGHPHVCCGPETSLFLPGRFDIERIAYGYGIPASDIRTMVAESGSQAGFIDLFADRYRHSQECTRWAEKTPLNIWHVGWILERFPEAHIVHVIRDGRDVVCSMRDYPDMIWAGDHWEKRPRHFSVAEYARRWVTHTGKGLAWQADPRYVEVRYEQLVVEPAETLERLLGALDLEPASGLAGIEPRTTAGESDGPAPKSIKRSSVGRWHEDLSADDLATVMSIAGVRLKQLGYD